MCQLLSLKPKLKLGFSRAGPNGSTQNDLNLRDTPVTSQAPGSPSFLIAELDSEVIDALHQLRTYLFKNEFMDAVTDEALMADAIFKLLVLITQHAILDSLAQYLTDFEAFFAQFAKDLAHCRQTDLQIITKINNMGIEWDLNEISEKKIEETALRLKNDINGLQVKKAHLDDKVSFEKTRLADLILLFPF